MKTFLESVDDLSARQREAIRAALLPTALAAVENAPPTTWVPVELNVALTEAVARELPGDALLRFYRTMLTRESDTSMFKGFKAMIGRLLGITPRALLKLAPEGASMMYRDCGHYLSVPSTDESTGALRYEGIPAVCRRNDVWLEAVRMAFYGFFDLCEVSGDVTWEGLDLRLGRGVLVFRWSPRRSR